MIEVISGEWFVCMSKILKHPVSTVKRILSVKGLYIDDRNTWYLVCTNGLIKNEFISANKN